MASAEVEASRRAQCASVRTDVEMAAPLLVSDETGEVDVASDSRRYERTKSAKHERYLSFGT